MLQSKIAIVIAPSIATWDSFTAIAEIITAVPDAGGMALIIPSQNTEDGIAAILQMVDGVVLVCPEVSEERGHRSTEPDDAYARAFGRSAIESGINAVKIIGDRSFFGTDKEWQDWAFFSRAVVQSINMKDIDSIKETLNDFVPSAQVKSAFARLARDGCRGARALIKSPATHG